LQCWNSQVGGSPILTYGKQGTTKPGCKPEDHAIVYSEGQKSLALTDEVLIKRPIRVVMKDREDPLHFSSRINYAKVYTVEHNTKVHFIGKVHKDYENNLITDYRATQEIP
jgi:hypothetical protein